MENQPGIIRFNNCDLHYDIFGCGQSVLLLGGGPGASPEYLYPVVSQLCDRWQCIVFHQRGTGRSVELSLDAEKINLHTAVEDVEALRKHMQVDEWTIIGHSWGGMLGAACAVDQPGRVKSLVFIGSPGVDHACSKYANDNLLSYLTIDERRIIDYWSSPERIHEPEAQNHISNAYAPSCIFDRTLEPAVAQIFMSINSKMETLIRQSLEKEHFNVAEPLSTFIKPVTIIQGRQDYIGEGAALRLQDVFPNSKLIWIERASHFPWLDQPENFRKCILGALTH